MSYSYIFDLRVIKNFENEDLHFKKKIVNLYWSCNLNDYPFGMKKNLNFEDCVIPMIIHLQINSLLYFVAIYKPDPEIEYTEDSPVKQYDYMSNLVKEWEFAARIHDDVQERCRQVILRSGQGPNNK